MFFWFIATAVLTVWYVFRDPRFDYRLLVVGSVLPDVDGLFGGARVMHSVWFSVALLVVVMLVTAGRKPARRLLLGLPIGTFLHLVFDGAWAATKVFWWPVGGTSFGAASLPTVERGWWSLMLEAIGIALCVWIWRRARLGEPARRARFRHHGELLLAGG